MMEMGHTFTDAEESEFSTMSRESRILDPLLSLGETPDAWIDHRGGEWSTPANIDNNMNIPSRDHANSVQDDHFIAGPETLEKAWTWAVSGCSTAWAVVEPVVGDYFPEDRNPFWVCGTLFLVFVLVITGLQAGSKPNPPKNGLQKEVAKYDKLPPISAPYVKLPDGRRVAYREQGINQEAARHTILVVHGFPSSRLAGIPGIKTRLLEEFGVRLIAYDRPGFGESDPFLRSSLRASAQDMANIADYLGVEGKFWVVGYSTGGIHAWAAMKYIPDRLAGVSVFAPGGNFYAPNMTKRGIFEPWRALTFRQKLLYRIARWAPSVLPFFCQKMFLDGIQKLQSNYLVTIGKDNVLMQNDMFMRALMRDIQESIRQTNAAVVANEFLVQVHPWGFHLSDFRLRQRMPSLGFLYRLMSIWKEEETVWKGFSAPIHIWQGTEDQIVPPAINEYTINMVPQAVLHRLDGEGHFSYFWFCDKCHRNIFLAMFKEPEGPRIVAFEPLSAGLETYYEANEQVETTA